MDDTSSLKVQPTTLKMLMGSAYIPKRNHSKPLGEDAHFISNLHQIFGLADGVGGWARKRIDSGIYARTLMDNATFAICKEPESADIDPKKILNMAYSNTYVKGSSTACLITLRHDNVLHCINVGDSGFVVIRGGVVIYKSPIQQLEFNFPYQLALTGANIPKDGEKIEVEVKAGDIIVAGSDGLFDNVFENELEEVVRSSFEESRMQPDKLARRITDFALEKAEDATRSSPFEQGAIKAGITHQGGKYDDITVVVAYVRQSQFVR